MVPFPLIYSLIVMLAILDIIIIIHIIIYVMCTYTHFTQVCQNEVQGGAQFFSLGKNVAANWIIASMSPLSFSITYTGGDPVNNISRYLQTCHLKQAYVAYYNIMVVFPFSFTLDNQLSSLPMIQELHPWLSLTKTTMGRQ